MDFCACIFVRYMSSQSGNSNGQVTAERKRGYSFFRVRYACSGWLTISGCKYFSSLFPIIAQRNFHFMYSTLLQSSSATSADFIGLTAHNFLIMLFTLSASCSLGLISLISFMISFGISRGTVPKAGGGVLKAGGGVLKSGGWCTKIGGWCTKIRRWCTKQLIRDIVG